MCNLQILEQKWVQYLWLMHFWRLVVFHYLTLSLNCECLESKKTNESITKWTIWNKNVIISLIIAVIIHQKINFLNKRHSYCEYLDGQQLIWDIRKKVSEKLKIKHEKRNTKNIQTKCKPKERVKITNSILYKGIRETASCVVLVKKWKLKQDENESLFAAERINKLTSVIIQYVCHTSFPKSRTLRICSNLEF